MKFEVERDVLFNALQNIINAVSPKSTLPILANVLLDINKNELRLVASDLRISMATQLEIKGNENLQATVNARKFFEMIREFPPLPLTIEIKDSIFNISFQKGEGLYQLAGMPADDFPKLPEKEEDNHFSIKWGPFVQMIRRTVFAVSSDETRISLNGVYLKIDKGEIRMVATDGHKLGKVLYRESFNLKEPAETIIPPQALTLIEKNTTDPDEWVQVYLNKKMIIFEVNGTTIYSRPLEGPYPNYEKVIPNNNKKRALLEREPFIETLKRVSILSNSRTHQVKLTLRKNKLEFSANNKEMGGRAKEELAAEYNEDDLEIGFNAQYLIDILKLMESDKVLMSLNTSIAPTLFFPVKKDEKEDYMFLIMPLRLLEES